MPSPLERMIDAVAIVCTKCSATACDCWTPKDDPRLKAVLDSYAAEVASNVLAHIDTHYPAMWTPVATNARRSVRNTVYREVYRVLTDIFDAGETS